MLIDPTELRALAEGKQYRKIAAELMRLESERGSLDLNAVAADPESALSGHPEVQVEYDPAPRAGCSVFGYYRPRFSGPSLIFVHPALTAERDNFTIVHELGHHVQRQHLEWAQVRHSISGAAGRRLEERVADAFAAEVLIPAERLGTDTSWLSAREIAEVYGRVRASRAAVAMRAIDLTPEGEYAVVAVTNSEGVVTFARASGDDVYAPARGVVQPGLAGLIAIAKKSGGYASGDISEGLQHRSGWAQQDLIAEIAMDDSWSHAFAVVRSSHRFGPQRVWVQVELECPKEACGTVFITDENVQHCQQCSTPRCPECSACACEQTNATFCDQCTMQLSPAEQENRELHECI